MLEWMMELQCPLDALDDDALTDSVLGFVLNVQEPKLSIGELDEYYATIAPRSIFYKNISTNADLLDLGAGDGTMVNFREWPVFKRDDIGMFAFSLETGCHFPRYNGYELGDFEEKFPEFDGRFFDAILCAHFIQHLRDPERCIQWISQRLKRGGRFYPEWPHAISKRMPKSAAIRALGLNVSTTNFFDDGTNVETWEMTSICQMLRTHALSTEVIGRTHYPFLAKELKNVSLKTDNQVHGTFAVWSFSAWAQYVAGAKL
jgi:SAM-dependent methyltransferase